MSRVIAGFFWAVTLVWCWDGYREWARAREMARWPGAPAAMASVRCVQEKIGAGYQPRAELSYTYIVGASTYAGKDRVPGCAEGSRALRPLRLLGSYKRAFYDPEKPNVSVLSTERSFGLECAIGLVLAGIAFFTTLLAFRPDYLHPTDSLDGDERPRRTQ